jgi:molybdopterin biosynthesis enzyme
VRGSTLVFGLPGNPVSSLVGFELFVRPALLALQGAAVPGPVYLPGRLGGRCAATSTATSCCAHARRSTAVRSCSNRLQARSHT